MSSTLQAQHVGVGFAHVRHQRVERQRNVTGAVWHAHRQCWQIHRTPLGLRVRRASTQT